MILTAHPIVNSRRMTWLKSTRSYACEISDIGPMTRVYDDACDVGLTLQSADGTQSIVFVVSRTHRDGEGEVTGWTLTPADQRDRGFTVIVFND